MVEQMRRQVVRDATHSRKTPVVVSVSKLVSVVGDTDGHDADNIRKLALYRIRSSLLTRVKTEIMKQRDTGGASVEGTSVASSGCDGPTDRQPSGAVQR